MDKYNKRRNIKKKEFIEYKTRIEFEINKLNNRLIELQNKSNYEINKLNNTILQLENNKSIYENRIVQLEKALLNNLYVSWNYNNNNICINNFNYNNNNNYNSNTTQLFFKVWRNVVIRKEILKHRDIYKTIAFSSQQLFNHPYRDYIVELEYRGTELLKAGAVPSTVKILKIFNGQIQVGSINHGVTQLIFGKYFNTQLTQNMIPSSTKSVIFEIQSYYNHPLLPNVFPSSIEHIQFGYHFNQPISQGVFKDGLITLKLGYTFNHKLEINTIPSTVQTLSILYDYYNHLIDYDSVKHVKEINLHCNYALQIDDKLISKIKMKFL